MPRREQRYLPTPQGQCMAVIDQIGADAAAEGVDVDYGRLVELLDRNDAVEIAARAGVHFSGDAWRLLQSSLRARAGSR